MEPPQSVRESWNGAASRSAPLWQLADSRMTDWALQLATYNFSAVLMHVGGQNVYYNVSSASPIVAVPPTDISPLRRHQEI